MPEIDEEKFWDEFERIKAKQSEIAMEALQDIFHRIPFGEEITFANGKKGKIDVFFEPKVNTDRDDHLGGVPCAGIDVTFDDGHLEFIIYHSGFGGDALKFIGETNVERREERDKD